MKQGIDISSHNGTIDMEKVKKSGIEFIILRMGYGKNSNQIDKRFYENYNKALEFQIPVGVYLYSYALNIESGLEEANFVLNVVKDLKLEYPIFIDMEDADGYKAKNNVSYSTCIDICEKFCDQIEKSGYYTGIYANLDWLNNKINDSRLDRFDKWVAQWSNKCTYKKDFGLWQYSSRGIISGINGYVDLNYSLKDYPKIIEQTGLNKLNTNKIVYIVQANDNLSKIAQKYNISWQTIYELNKNIIGNDPNIIKVGQELIIKEK